MFCIKCGAKLPDDAQFCYHCGAQVYAGEEAPPPPAPPEMPARPVFPAPLPVKQRPKWLLPLIAGASVAALLVVVGIWTVVGWGRQEPAIEPAARTPAATVTSAVPTEAPAATETPAAPTESPAATATPAAPTESPAAQVDFNQVVDEILTEIEGSSGFLAADSYYDPLVSFTDVDGNGVHELLCLYKVEGDGVPEVVYDAYAVRADGSYTALCSRQSLYLEAGGNSGAIGLVVNDDKCPYLKLDIQSPQGDRFNDTIIYIPWGGDQEELGDAWVYLESHGLHGEEDRGQYILGDTKVDKAAFDARQADFTSLWTDLDLFKGHGNGGNTADFAGIRQFFDLNTYDFGTA